MELSFLDEKIRKYEKLKKVLSDPDVQEVLDDPELVALIESLHKLPPKTANGNGGNPAPRQLPPPPPTGTLLGETLKAARSHAEPFSAGEIVATMGANQFTFEAGDSRIAVNGALRTLHERGFITLKQQGIGRRPTLYENPK
jgi:hypothetical protein